MKDHEKGNFDGRMCFIVNIVEVEVRLALGAYMKGDREWARKQKAPIVRCGSTCDSHGNEVSVCEGLDEWRDQIWIKAPDPLVRLAVPMQIKHIATRHED